MSRPSRRLAALPFLLLAGASASCFEIPVRESLEIVFRARDAAEIGVRTRIAGSAWDEKQPAAAARVGELSDALLRREDEWSRVFGSLDPAAERIGYELHGGKLREADHRVVLTDPAAVAAAFRSMPLAAHYGSDGARATFEIVPAGGNRATPRQERIVRERLDLFGADVARYLEAAGALWGRFGKDPSRARPCLEKFFGDVVAEEDRRGETLTEDEERLVEALSEAAGALTGILVFAEGEAFTLDEMSQLVHDPFAAETEIEVAGTIEEVEGFERRGENRVGVRRSGFWGALESLEGEWLAPDPVTALVKASRREGESKLDLDEFVARPRAFRGVPRAEAVRAALEAGLRPAALYRLVWTWPEAEAVSGEPGGDGRR